MMIWQQLTRVYAIVLTGAVLAGLAFGYAAGQEASTMSPPTPLVIGVAQEVPVIVDAPVTLSSGEIVTATTPFTVEVELRIQVEGAQQSTVKVVSAPEPVVFVAPAIPHLVTDVASSAQIAIPLTEAPAISPVLGQRGPTDVLLMPDASLSDCPCDSDTQNCGDFAEPFDAQACYLRCLQIADSDVHGLDRDGDGDACEWDK